MNYLLNSPENIFFQKLQLKTNVPFCMRYPTFFFHLLHVKIPHEVETRTFLKLYVSFSRYKQICTFFFHFTKNIVGKNTWLIWIHFHRNLAVIETSALKVQVDRNATDT